MNAQVLQDMTDLIRKLHALNPSPENEVAVKWLQKRRDSIVLSRNAFLFPPSPIVFSATLFCGRDVVFDLSIRSHA